MSIEITGQKTFSAGSGAAAGALTFVYVGPLSGIPATATVGQLAFITDAVAGQNIYEAASTNTFTQQVTATGSISAVQSLDVSTFAGADLGAQINAAQATAPAAGCILDCRNIASPQNLSTAVNITGPHRILAAGLIVTQTATITLSGAHSGLIGTLGRAFILNKGGNLAEQILVSGADVVIDNVTLDGKVASGYTGNGIQINNTTARSIISNSTIQNQFTDAIHDLGSVDLVVDKCYINNAAGVDGYNQLTNANTNARIVDSVFVDSASSTGSAVVLATSNAYLTMIGCRLLTAANVPSVNGGAGGTIFITNCKIQNTAGYATYTHTACIATIIGSTLTGGGAGAPNIDVASGQIFISDSTVAGQGNAHCISVGSMTSGHCNISNNQLSQVFASTGFAIVYLYGDAIGNVVHHNSFKMGDSSPTGDNYCILQVPGPGTHWIEHIFSDNIMFGGPSAHDVAYRIDNSVNNLGTAGGLTVIGNKFIDIGGVCIQRVDPSGTCATTFMNNFSQDGALFDATASSAGTNDTIIQLNNNSWTPASFPTCGTGVIQMTGTPTNPVRVNASYSTLAMKSGASAWAGLRSPEVGQNNLTAVTTNTGATVLASVGVANAQFLITWNAKVTTVGSSSSTLGPLLLDWTDPDGTEMSYVAVAAQKAGGSVVTSDAANTLGTFLVGVPMLINCKAGTTINYSFDFTSNAATGACNFNIVAEIR